MTGNPPVRSAPPALSIIIVSYNARADLERCLASLVENPPAASHEIIVVDNASADHSADAARGRGAQVIETGANLGFARATNVGIRASRGTNVLLLNSDTIVRRDAIDRLLRVLADRPDIAIVGPRLVDGEGRAELSFGRMIGPWTEWRQKRLVDGNDRRDPAISATVDRMTRQEQIVDWVSGACLLVRRTAADRAGLFDERFFLYTEDVDFCATVRAIGGKVLFLPAAEIAHLRGRSGIGAPHETYRAYTRSRLAFYEKHHPAWAPVLRLLIRLRGTDISSTP
jgi:N-acetylglucosaminyl-diphospho-decaprenol L-rhamnosyltransferase